MKYPMIVYKSDDSDYCGLFRISPACSWRRWTSVAPCSAVA